MARHIAGNASAGGSRGTLSEVPGAASVPPRLAAGRRSVAPVPAPVAVFRRRPARAGEAQDEAMPMLENPFHLHRDSLQVSEAPQRGALRIAFRFDASSAGRASLRPADALPAAASAHERPGLGADSAAAEAVIVSTDAAFESGIGQSCELEWALRTGDRALATAEAEEGRRRLFLAVDLRIGSAVASAIAWERTVLAVCPVASPLVAAEEASDTAAASAAGEQRPFCQLCCWVGQHACFLPGARSHFGSRQPSRSNSRA
mmetsp:Transcript_100260/g.269272  ORF Transcript_100260/g.269272 Transcript_100260/m.269272 type:complete len:260 (+) Transcript_100260:33-812(+)